MPLATDQALSFYEVLGPLGAGGMGEAHLAEDTRLVREVAVAGREERPRRIEREAMALAPLDEGPVRPASDR